MAGLYISWTFGLIEALCFPTRLSDNVSSSL